MGFYMFGIMGIYSVTFMYHLILTLMQSQFDYMWYIGFVWSFGWIWFCTWRADSRKTNTASGG